MHHYLGNKRTWRVLGILTLITLLLYGAGRFYYHVTDGFALANISYDIPFDPRWEVPPPAPETQEAIETVLSQPFYYLGKGCQSYVFASEDGRYVVKFFKYQRFRPQEWLKNLSFIPAMETYRLNKIEKKKRKLEGVLASWKIAYEHLQKETGVVYVHLNKGGTLPAELVLFDKMGLKHSVDLNQTEFLVQKKADMLCPTLERLMKKGNQGEAEKILAGLVSTLVSEYQRGFADNDHALMQNTGVLEGHPLHVDVGQFVKNPIVQNPEVYNQEIVNKSYKFQRWLKEKYPALADYYEARLVDVIGEQYWSMKPIFYTADMARIPNA